VAFEDGKVFPDNRQISLVEITEWGRYRFPGYPAPNEIPRVMPLLYSDLGYARQRFTILLQRRSVADDENLGMIQERKIRLDAHAARMTGFCIEPFRRGRGGNPGRPDNRLAGDAFAGNNDPVFVDTVHTLAEPDLYTELF
jgi:hypothetical protein